MIGRDAPGDRRQAGKPPRKATRQSLENAALHYLERFAASADALRRVLMRRVERSAQAHDTDRAEGAAMVDAILERFRQSGLLNDAVYAEGRTATLHRRGASARGVPGAARGASPGRRACSVASRCCWSSRRT